MTVCERVEDRASDGERERESNLYIIWSRIFNRVNIKSIQFQLANKQNKKLEVYLIFEKYTFKIKVAQGLFLNKKK